MGVAEAINAEDRASDQLQIDESTVRYLRPGTGESWTGQLRHASRPGGGDFHPFRQGPVLKLPTTQSLRGFQIPAP